jgi:hypothetical protein
LKSGLHEAEDGGFLLSSPHEAPMSALPYPFDPETYARWHNAQYPADDPVLDNVKKLRADLVAGSRDQLTVLAQVLTYAVNYSLNEYQQTAKTSTGYHLSLSDALTPKPGATDYDQLFKSTPSIINKLWRKNRDAPPAHLGNIQQHITDLVRTDISATTLDSAAFLARRMNALPGIIYEPLVISSILPSASCSSFARNLVDARRYASGPT